MNRPRIALCIPHTPWRPERVASYGRLREQIGKPHDVPVATFADRQPNFVWSEKLWSWACSPGANGADYLLQLQDDVIVAPDFWRHLRAMLECAPGQVIGLEAAHPLGTEVDVDWYSTPDMLIGVGYVVPVPLLREFLDWRSKLRKGAIESVSEDTLLGLWTFATGRRILHPVPTIIDHDTDLPSTYGNDDHKHRKPVVTWKDRPVPSTWRKEADAFTRFYAATPRLAKRWIVGATEEDYAKWIGL